MYASEGSGLFSYAADGVMVTSFEPALPGQRFGDDPDRLLPQMRQVGLDPEVSGAEASSRRAAMKLAALAFGVSIDEFTMFDKELPTAVIG